MGRVDRKSHCDRKKLTRTMKTKKTMWSNAKQKFIKTRREVQVSYKVKEFIKAFPIGTYLVTVRAHAIAIINGKIIGILCFEKSIS